MTFVQNKENAGFLNKGDHLKLLVFEMTGFEGSIITLDLSQKAEKRLRVLLLM